MGAFVNGNIQLGLCNVAGGSIAFLFLSIFDNLLILLFHKKKIHRSFPSFSVFVSLFELRAFRGHSQASCMEITSQKNKNH